MASPHRPRLTMLFAALLAVLILAARVPRSQPPSGGCGPTSLYALTQTVGMHVGRNDVGRLFGSHFLVASFADIQEAARLLGLELQGQRMSVETLQRERPLGILHLDGSHFVAVVGYEAYGPRVVDPDDASALRVAVWPYTYLSERWDGRILVFTGVQAHHAGANDTAGRTTR